MELPKILEVNSSNFIRYRWFLTIAVALSLCIVATVLLPPVLMDVIGKTAFCVLLVLAVLTIFLFGQKTYEMWEDGDTALWQLRREEGVCWGCGYDPKGLERCPECGNKW